MERIRLKLGLSGDASESAVLARIEALQAELHEHRAAEAVDLAVQQGRIGVHTRRWWLRHAIDDLPATRAALAAQPARQFTVHSRALTAEEREAADLFGFDPTHFAQALLWLDCNPQKTRQRRPLEPGASRVPDDDHRALRRSLGSGARGRPGEPDKRPLNSASTPMQSTGAGDHGTGPVARPDASVARQPDARAGDPTEGADQNRSGA